MQEAPKPTFHTSPAKPRLRLPPGAWDTHCHVFGPATRFPLAPGWPPRADAPKETLFALHQRLGIERCVIVGSSAYGLDNRVEIDALAAKRGKYLGVALLPPTVPLVELKRLDRLGFRGVRFNFVKHHKPDGTIDEVMALAPRLAEVGWHLQIHCDSDQIDELGARLAQAPVPVVIDHVGRVDAGLGTDGAEFQSLLRLMERPHLWLKVSGCDRITRTGPPYTDAAALARAAVERFPDRVVWGTDWPHPNHKGPIPDDGQLVDLIGDIAPTEALRAKLLIANPRRLYEARAAR